jgi:hypothetical protein
VRSTFPPSASIRVYLRFKSAIDRCVKKRARPFPHPRPSACICGSKVRSPLRQKERSTFPPSASISVYLRFKSAIDRCVKKGDRPFPHPHPSACICGSKVRSPFPYSCSSLRSGDNLNQPRMKSCIVSNNRQIF